MKKNAAVYFVCILLWSISFPVYLLAQEAKINWEVSGQEKNFIENKGQFDGRNKLPGSEILYAVDHGEMQIFFTKQGVTYYFEKKVKNPNRKKGDRTKPRLLKETELVHFTWEGANPNVTLTAKEKSKDYHNYSFLTADKSSAFTITDVYGYKKLVYKNLYPNIDVEYVFHPDGGIKYSLILHPNADASLVKMKYSDNADLTVNSAGKIIIPTFMGDIIEHAPVTFYGNNNVSIPSQFVQQGKTISFQLVNYNHSKTVIIDPWVQTPALSSSNCVWECEKDASGNVYIIGGDTPMRLRKYNSTGALQWTYNTPWDTTSNDWLGTLATDLAGNSYVTNGSNAAIEKINTSGSRLWGNTGSIFPATEYWSVQFNCDQTKLVIGGTVLGSNSGGYVFDVNTNNGNEINKVQVAGSRGIDPNEVRAITSSRNARYYYLTLDKMGSVNQNFAGCTPDAPDFSINSTYNFSYKSENYRPNNGNSGICAIRANDKFVYSQNGTTIHKRSLLTGAIITTASIPGGISVVVPFFNNYQPGNSGIDIDDCGNVFVGSGNQVIKYDADLNLLTTQATPFRVYDVTVSYNGDIIICGATGNNSSSSRTGYVQSLNMSACPPFALICCDATICPVGPYCSTDGPVNLSRITAGGTWSGTGITNTSIGIFSPVAAGVGTHTISYTLGCGIGTMLIDVNFCASLSVCIQPNGQYTASGGNAPYTWQTGVPFTNCNACPIPGFCIPFICPGFPDTTWTTFATGTTVTPPGTFPIRVRDAGVNVLVMNSAAALPACAPCPAITLNISSQTNVNCFGLDNGSATVNAVGGLSPHTFTWQPGTLTGPTQNNLAAGTYNITVSDQNACTGTGSVTITSPNELSLIAFQTDATCAGNDGMASVLVSGGTPPYNYTWSNQATTDSITGLAAGNYTVTVRDNNNCPAAASVTIVAPGGFSVSLNSQTNVTCNGANNGAVNISVTGGNPPYSFLWTGGATTEDISGLPGGTYSVTISDDNNCNAILSATITEPLSLNISGVVTNASCGTTGGIDITVTGGTLPNSYSWTGGATTEDLNNIQGGTYSVTVLDDNTCSDSSTFIVSSVNGPVISLTPTAALCDGVANGSITSSVSGGSSPYQYIWSNSATTSNLPAAAGGTYSLTVTDNSGCTTSLSSTISSPSSIRSIASITRVLCDFNTNGGIKLIVSGGTPPYGVLWNNGETTESISDLAPGIYSAVVTDSNGCVYDTTIALTSVSGLLVRAVATNASCDGTINGSVQAVILSGNASPFSYSWNTGATTSSISNILPGTYSVTVVDSLNCPKHDTAVVYKAGLEIDEMIQDVSCPDSSNGFISVTVFGGVPPYIYDWSNGQSTAAIYNLSAGLYSLFVIDDDDCSGMDTFTVAVDPGGINCEKDSLVIYSVFSPNGDGRNDLWVIDGLEKYAENEMQIFNRWGNLVFEASPYINSWDGYSKKGNPLPVATYYYILKLNNAAETIYSGHITIVR